MTINKDDHQIPIKHLFFIFFLLCEHSIMIVEDFEFALTTQVSISIYSQLGPRHTRHFYTQYCDKKILQ